MKSRTYNLLSEAVEKGALTGVRRAFKHTDQPSHEQIAVNVEREIMNAICEWFCFDDDGY
jgi:hypothetical protein